MHILDTDTLTHLQKRNSGVIENLERVESYDVVGITIVTRAEVLRGRLEFLLKADDKYLLDKAQRLLLDSERFLQQIPTIQFEKESLAKFDELRQNSKFRKIGRNDLLIASICFAKKAVLVTRNIKHFKQFPNLDVVNWVS